MAARRSLRLFRHPKAWGFVALAALALVPQGLRAARRHHRHTVAAHARHKRNSYIPAVDHKVVESGDTLWSLCDEVTGKPWLWPQVWALNPAITNPHWLHPGTVVTFVPQGRGHVSGAVVASNIDMPAVQDVDVEVPPTAHRAPAVEVISTRLEPSKNKRALPQHVFAGNFISRQELADAGRLTNAAPDKILLRSGDDLFVTFAGDHSATVGERFYLFRTADTVRHPVTGATWGYMTEITGLATVTAIQSGVARARLDHTVLEVERGQRVMPYSEDLLLDVQPNAKVPDVAGIILAVQGARPAVGEQSLVFVDKGKNDGIERGVELSVASHADPLTRRIDSLPTVDMATLLVVDAKETTATCLVIDALYEIWPGDTFHAGSRPAP
jgi:hypothetical protein